MGASISTNSINNMVNNAINVANTIAVSCTMSGNNLNNVINLQGCTIAGGGSINIDETQIISQVCVSDATVSNSIHTAVQQSIRQTAKAIVQQFAFGTIAAAEDFINSSVNIGETISNSFVGVCNNKASSGALTLNCTNSVIAGAINFTTYQEANQTCTFNTVFNTKVYNHLIQLLSQTATATQESTFAYILFAFVAILAIGAWFVISIADTPLVQWAIVGLVLFFVIGSIIYTATARSRGLYPYKGN